MYRVNRKLQGGKYLHHNCLIILRCTCSQKFQQKIIFHAMILKQMVIRILWNLFAINFNFQYKIHHVWD